MLSPSAYRAATSVLQPLSLSVPRQPPSATPDTSPAGFRLVPMGELGGMRLPPACLAAGTPPICLFSWVMQLGLRPLVWGCFCLRDPPWLLGGPRPALGAFCFHLASPYIPACRNLLPWDPGEAPDLSGQGWGRTQAPGLSLSCRWLPVRCVPSIRSPPKGVQRTRGGRGP